MDKYKISGIEAWVKPANLALEDPYGASSPYYFILADYQELVTDDAISRYQRTVEKINDASRIEDASLFMTELQDNNHQIVFHSIDIIRDGNRLSVLNEEKISVHQREKSLENHITDQAYTVSISIDDLRVGDIIDYQATSTIFADDHPLNGKYYYSLFWLGWNCPVYYQHIRITNQSTQSISVQESTTNNGVRQQTTQIIPQTESLIKVYNDIRPVFFENVVPNWLWPDSLLATTHSEWQALSAYLYNYYESCGIFDNAINLSEMGIINPDDKIEDNLIKIVRFVQNEIRYKGENHGVFTHTPKKSDLILKNRYGDCKDKANLLVALLKCIGVKAYLTLVNTDYGIKIGQLSPSLYLFNHMIVHVELEHQKQFYFDPTIKKQAGDLYHSVPIDYGYGLILTDKGNTLKKLPHDISQNIFWLKHIFDFTKSSSDKNTLTIRRAFYAHRANNIRYYLHSREQEILTTEYLQYAKDESNLDLSVIRPITIVSDNTQLNELKTEEIYTIHSLSESNNLLHLPTNIYSEFPTSTNENHPLRIDLDGRITHDIEIIYKEKVPKATEKQSIENEWFSYHDSITTNGNTTYLMATAIPHKKYVESKDLKSYLNEVEQVRGRSSNNFPYKLENYTAFNQLASGMFVSAILISVILIAFSKFH